MGDADDVDMAFAWKPRVDQPSWMLVRVALETRSHHAVADADRLVLLEDPTAASYRRFLGRVFGLEASFEVALAHTHGLEPSLVRGCERTHHLARDLNALGMSAAEIARLPRFTQIPRFQTAVRALGWLYAIERNALVHGLVSRHLAMHVPDAIKCAGTYLTAYEGHAGDRLRRLGAVLSTAGRGPLAVDRIVAGATEAFQAQHRWYSPISARADVPLERATA